MEAVGDAVSQTKLACNGAFQSVSLLQFTLLYFLKESRNFDIQLLKIPTHLTKIFIETRQSSYFEIVALVLRILSFQQSGLFL
jgi:hypothetical protein